MGLNQVQVYKIQLSWINAAHQSPTRK